MKMYAVYALCLLSMAAADAGNNNNNMPRVAEMDTRLRQLQADLGTDFAEIIDLLKEEMGALRDDHDRVVDHLSEKISGLQYDHEQQEVEIKRLHDEVNRTCSCDNRILDLQQKHNQDIETLGEKYEIRINEIEQTNKVQADQAVKFTESIISLRVEQEHKYEEAMERVEQTKGLQADLAQNLTESVDCLRVENEEKYEMTLQKLEQSSRQHTELTKKFTDGVEHLNEKHGRQYILLRREHEETIEEQMIQLKTELTQNLNARIEQLVQGQGQEIGSLRNAHERRILQLEQTSLLQGTKIAFAATALKPSFTTYLKGDTIIFDHQDLDEGDGYDSTKGEYICPVSGVYIFSVHITITNVTVHVSENSFYLRRGDTSMMRLMTPEDAGKYSGASGSITYHCTKGQRVYVQRCNCDDEDDSLRVLNQDYSHFSGVLIHRD